LTQKIVFEATWNGGRVHVETGSVKELMTVIRDLRDQPNPPDVQSPQLGMARSPGSYPSIGANQGCKRSITEVLTTPWGRTEPRTETEITEVLKANSVHYPRGTISGVLAQMAKGGEIRRVGKKEGAYAYVLGTSAKASSKPIELVAEKNPLLSSA
jgi:hypothetical protein